MYMLLSNITRDVTNLSLVHSKPHSSDDHDSLRLTLKTAIARVLSQAHHAVYQSQPSIASLHALLPRLLDAVKLYEPQMLDCRSYKSISTPFIVTTAEKLGMDAEVYKTFVFLLKKWADEKEFDTVDEEKAKGTVS